MRGPAGRRISALFRVVGSLCSHGALGTHACEGFSRKVSGSGSTQAQGWRVLGVSKQEIVSLVASLIPRPGDVGELPPLRPSGGWASSPAPRTAGWLSGANVSLLFRFPLPRLLATPNICSSVYRPFVFSSLREPFSCRSATSWYFLSALEMLFMCFGHEYFISASNILQLVPSFPVRGASGLTWV